MTLTRPAPFADPVFRSFGAPIPRLIARALLAGTFILTAACSDSGEPNSAQTAPPPEAEESGDPETPPESSPSPEPVPTLAALNVPAARLEILSSGLTLPWAFEFLNDGELIINQLGGEMIRFDLRSRELTRIRGVPEVATGHEQTGLLDVALHPRFEQNGRIYFTYVAGDPESGKYYATVLDTAVLDADRLVEVERLLTATPYGWSPANFGGMIEFDGTGYLYVSIGDRSEKIVAQQGNRLQGKILRLNDDGSVPEDNPFVGNPNIDDRIYALGVRNPQGLYYDPVTDLLYEAEHGPMGGDEVNIIEAGANYGWPIISYGQNYTAEKMGLNEGNLDDPLIQLHLTINPDPIIGVGTHQAGMKQPLFYYLPSIAASPLTMVRGEMFPEWEGHLLVGALGGRHISKLDLDDGVIRSEFPMLTEIGERIRDIRVASDGSIYILAQNGTLHRLYRPDEIESDVISPTRSGEAIYQMVCSGCHDTGASDAPILARPEQWTAILERPRTIVYRRLIEGYGAMPERGLCYACTDDQLRTVTDYMLDRVENRRGDSTGEGPG